MKNGIGGELPEIKFPEMPVGAQAYFIRNSESLFRLTQELKALGFESWDEVFISKINPSPRVLNALICATGESDFTLGHFVSLKINMNRIPNFGEKSISEFLGKLYALQFYWDKSEPKTDHSDFGAAWTAAAISAKDLNVIRDAESWRALVGWVNSRIAANKKGIFE